MEWMLAALEATGLTAPFEELRFPSASPASPRGPGAAAQRRRERGAGRVHRGVPGPVGSGGALGDLCGTDRERTDRETFGRKRAQWHIVIQEHGFGGDGSLSDAQSVVLGGGPVITWCQASDRPVWRRKRAAPRVNEPRQGTGVVHGFSSGMA